MKTSRLRKRTNRSLRAPTGDRGGEAALATYVNRQGRTLQVLLEIHDDPRPDAILVALEAFASTELFVSSRGTVH